MSNAIVQAASIKSEQPQQPDGSLLRALNGIDTHMAQQTSINAAILQAFQNMK